MLEFELHAFHKVLHMAYTFKRAQVFNLPSLGGPSIRSIGAMCFSALHRTSRDTLVGIPEAFSSLRESVRDNLPFQTYNSFAMAPFFWKWKPFIAHLNEALQGQFFRRQVVQETYAKSSGQLNANTFAKFRLGVRNPEGLLRLFLR